MPLGPFTAKNFGTTISPWAVLADALEPHQAPALPNENTPLPYLVEKRKVNVLEIYLEVEFRRSKSARERAVVPRTCANASITYSCIRGQNSLDEDKLV